MKKIHFAAANGFPALSYEYLFSKLEISDISYINIMGHLPSANKANLVFLKDELIEHISKGFTQPVIGVGHSSGGAATMLAAAERPELFEQIILIDPPLFNLQKRLGLRLAQMTGIWRRFGPAKKANNRRAIFANKQEAFHYWKEKPLFKNFHPECFKSYVDHGLKQSGKSVELSFRPDVEEDIFFNLVTKFPQKMQNLKATLIYASNSDIFWQSDIDWWKKNHPNFNLVQFDGGHLFPFEEPDTTALLINQICAY